MARFTRTDWNARPPKDGPGLLDPDRVEGLAFHWPAMKNPLVDVDAVKEALRGWQDYHMDDRGWSDIAYQVAVDQAGNEYALRGLRTQSAANGNADVNERFGAVLLVVAPGEKLSPQLVATTRRIVARHRGLFPHSTRLVGHGQIRPDGTACPGPAVLDAIAAGRFEPEQPPNRVEQARVLLAEAKRRVRGAAKLLEETPEDRLVAQQGAVEARDIARQVRALLDRLPER